MGTNFIDFDSTGVTPVTDDTNAAAVSPITDGEAAIAVTFNRPTELLRKRTETLRTEADFQKYLTDADRGFVVSGGGTVSWGGATDVSAGTGVFSITSPITIRPFLSPVSSVRASSLFASAGTDVFKIAFTSGGAHAYEGGNKFRVKFVIAGAFSVTLTGTPANDLTVNLVSGTTTSALLALMNASTVFVANGLTSTLTSGAGTSNITAISAPQLFAATFPLLGGLDAERHVVGVTAVSDFCLANPLQQGDVVAIWYNALVDGSGGGRLESLPDYGSGAGTDKTGVVVGDLFNLRTNPERAPYAIPLCVVGKTSLDGNDNLIFLNQVSVVRGQPQTSLSAGYVQRVGDTMSGALAITPASLAVGTAAVTITTPGGAMATETTLAIVPASAKGLTIVKAGGSGNSFSINHAGGEGAAAIVNTGVAVALTVTNSNATSSFAASVSTAGAAAAARVVSSHATGVGLEVRTSSVGTTPAATTLYIEGMETHTLLTLRPRPGFNATTPVSSIDVIAPPTSGVIATSGIRTLSGNATNLTVTSANAVGLRCMSLSTSPAASFEAEDWTSYGAATAVLVKGKPASAGSLIHAENTSAGVSGTFALIRSSVKYIAGNTGTAISAITENINDVAISGVGRSILSLTGVGSVLTLTPGTGAAALVITPVATALPGAPVIGSLGMESFLNGAVPRARVRTGSAAAERSGVRTVVTLSAPWGTGGSEPFYWWIDLEGVVHLRCSLYARSSGLTIAGNASVSIGLAIMPLGARPLEKITAGVICGDSSGVLAGPHIFTVETGGDFTLGNRGVGAATNLTFFEGLSLTYPLW